MKRITIALAVIFYLAAGNIKADEGMWLLPLIDKLNITDMQELGFELTADDIYNINHSSIKDAIVVFGGGCTGEIISDQGLLLTNHHCGFDQIQNHSTVEHNYLEDGFWASNMDDELTNPDLTVKFLIRIENVTDKVLANVTPNMSFTQKMRIIDSASLAIEEAAVDTSHYNAQVKPFFGGNKYYLSVYETYPDVRLVGTPPNAIGKFGYDTDNWMWPRHTGDFSLFRVYSGPDGKPAPYAEDNIPLQPKHHLPISLNGIEKNDFAMILGYPGSTQRYMTSWEVNEVLEITHPNRIKIRGIKQEIIMADMQADPKVKIQYASKYSRSSNYWKFSIGQSKGLKRLNIYEKKQDIERGFTNWVNASEERIDKYGGALGLIQEAVSERSKFMHARQYLLECFYYGAELPRLALRMKGILNLLEEQPDSTNLINRAITEYKTYAKEFYSEYNAPTDRKVTRALVELYATNVPTDLQPAFYNTVNKKYKSNYDKYIEALFDKSFFVSQEQLFAFLEKPSARKIQKDLVFQLTNSFYEAYGKIMAMADAAEQKYQQGHRLFVAGLQEMNSDTKFYPDANFTMRLTYGTVQDLWAADAVYYNFETTLKGVMEKEDPGNWEFVVPEKLKSLYKTKDYGMYGKNDTMNVCFITNNDITGGNSGSPVLNAKGELIGLAFDGNWEAMSGDIVFEPELQRTISVDIRYVLFIIDKFAGATHLIDELTIVQKQNQ